MLRRLSSGHVVWKVEGDSGSFSPELLQCLKNWQQASPQANEAGGVLLGFIDLETGGILAEHLTLPGTGDLRTRTSFFRGKRHQKEAEAWHRATGRRGTQLGLWHTHPESKPIPSSTDWDDLRKVMATATYHSSGLIYIIVGTEYVGCWLGSRRSVVQEIGYFKI